MDPAPNDKELINAWLKAKRTIPAGSAANSYRQNFDELNLALTGNRLASSNVRFDLVNLMPQIVPGHRLWVEGTKKGLKGERFISVEKIEYWHSEPAQEIWLKIYLFLDDSRELG